MARARKVQYGGRITVYRGQPLQRGHGLGGIFRSLFRVAMPVIRRAAPIVKKGTVRAGRRVAKKAVKRAAEAGAQVLEDVVAKKRTLKDSLKQRAQEVALNTALDAINKGPVKKKSNTFTNARKKKVRKTIAPKLH